MSGEGPQRVIECPAASDGMPIVPGETLYGEDGKAWRVRAVGPSYVYGSGRDAGFDKRLRPEWLTHERRDSAVGNVIHLGDVRTFDDGPITLRSDCKDCATKVLEEAAEAVEAWKAHDRSRDYGTDDPDAMQSTPDPEARDALASELADVVQAACNLAAACGIDLRSAMDACEARSRARGRIADARDLK